MKLALLGFPVSHSKSPDLYREILGEELLSYELLSIEFERDLPSLKELSQRYNGLNITAPYKRHFFNEVIIPNQDVGEIGAINTIAFTPLGVIGENTDYIAVIEILQEFKIKYGKLHLILLGGGVMAKVTELAAQKLSLPLIKLTRSINGNIEQISLLKQDLAIDGESQVIVVNSCSREFVFQGKMQSDYIFWDYNYSFLPHEEWIPKVVKTYIDGRDMLKRQALAAVRFWSKQNLNLSTK
jgi:shikimate dehydrogenase